MTFTIRRVAALLLASTVVHAGAAAAQDGGAEGGSTRRTRVALGPQLVPSYPGSDEVNLRPFVDVSRADGDEPFAFEAADESFGFSLLNRNGFAVGPSLGFQGSRTAKDVGANLPKVGTTVEVGAFVQYELTPAFRLRGEGRKGIGGHKGWIGQLSADYIQRDGDDWLFSVGPRVTLTDNRYNDAYYSVRPGAAATSGLRTYDAGGGVQTVGANIGYLRQLTPTWGVQTYARYDQLVADAGDSPIVREYGSRNQLSGGVALLALTSDRAASLKPAAVASAITVLVFM